MGSTTRMHASSSPNPTSAIYRILPWHEYIEQHSISKDCPLLGRCHTIDYLKHLILSLGDHSLPICLGSLPTPGEDQNHGSLHSLGSIRGLSYLPLPGYVWASLHSRSTASVPCKRPPQGPPSCSLISSHSCSLTAKFCRAASGTFLKTYHPPTSTPLTSPLHPE